MKYVIEKLGNKEKIISVSKKKIITKKIIKFYKYNENSADIHIVFPKNGLFSLKEVRGLSKKVKDKIDFEDFNLN